MAGVSNRENVWRWTTLVAAIAAVDILLTFRNIWPTPAVRWSGDLSVELAACLLLMAAASYRVGAPSRRALRWLSVFGVFLVIGRYADVTVPALYGRDINLYFDGRRLSAVGAMLARPASWWLVLLVVTAAVVIPGILYLILRRALRRIGAAMAHPGERRVVTAVAALTLLWFAAQHIAPQLPDTPRFSAPVTMAYARQGRILLRELTTKGMKPIGPGPSFESELAGIRGADVFIVVIESYGAVSYDRPEFVAGLTGSRARLNADIHDTGRDVVSAFVESPTFGASSWLAHISLLTGIEVRDEDTSTRLMTEQRDTLVRAFGRHGYRTVAIMPGTQESWPEGAIYGFDEIYDEARLDYRGPPFGWWNVPDQFALARMDALEVSKPARAPLLVFFPTTNTHTPFSPTPPYQPDWHRVMTEQPYEPTDFDRAWERQPDWMNLGPSFVHALSYTYQSIGGYLRLSGNRDFVMIILGDHQPPAAVSGEGASWEVPVHVITSRKEVLESLLAHGFQPGLSPHHPAISRMHALVPTLLTAFGGGPLH
jgi:hypothetical protein